MLVVFNKPFNVLCQFTGQPGRETLAHYIPLKEVYPCGRLDRDSEGLLLLTNHGKLQDRIASPAYKLPKIYWVQVEGEISAEALARLSRGVEISDGVTRPAVAQCIEQPGIWPRIPPIRERKSVPTSWLELTIHEGRNRQVRRMTAAVGFPTLRLIRAAIGPWSLADLQPGQYRVIEDSQLRDSLHKVPGITQPELLLQSKTPRRRKTSGYSRRQR